MRFAYLNIVPAYLSQKLRGLIQYEVFRDFLQKIFQKSKKRLHSVLGLDELFRFRYSERF